MNNMEKKSDMVRRLVAEGDFKKALSIAKGFRLGFTKTEQNIMTRAHECMVHPGFYSQLGYDEAKLIEDGIDLVKRIYGE